MDKLQCDVCGGKLVMEKSGGFATCESCGMQYSVERIQEKIQEIKGTVKVDGPVEFIHGENEKATLLKNAVVYINLDRDYTAAKNIYSQVVDLYPGEPTGWWGLFYCTTEGLTKNLDRLFQSDSKGQPISIKFDENSKVLKWYERAIKLAEPGQKKSWEDQFSTAVNTYRTWLRSNLVETRSSSVAYYREQLSRAEAVDRNALISNVLRLVLGVVLLCSPVIGHVLFSSWWTLLITLPLAYFGLFSFKAMENRESKMRAVQDAVRNVNDAENELRRVMSEH